MAVWRIDEMVVVRGGGDIATGVVQKFHRAGFPVIILETTAPTAIRRSVSLCEAVYDGYKKVEDVVCRKVAGTDEIESCVAGGEVPLLIDPQGESIGALKPAAVIDAIIAKHNIGTNRGMAGVVIALGPGFDAGKDAHAVIETARGHDLGRMILRGYAKTNTGVPGDIGGRSVERVIRAPVAGRVCHIKRIGDVARQGEALFTVDGIKVCAPFTGLLRGLIREGLEAPQGMKVADMDPRIDVDWQTISDKARCIGGAALEAYLYFRNQ